MRSHLVTLINFPQLIFKTCPKRWHWNFLSQSFSHPSHWSHLFRHWLEITERSRKINSCEFHDDLTLASKLYLILIRGRIFITGAFNESEIWFNSILKNGIINDCWHDITLAIAAVRNPNHWYLGFTCKIALWHYIPQMVQFHLSQSEKRKENLLSGLINILADTLYS